MEHESRSAGVFLSASVFGSWEQKHGRDLSVAERHTIGKIALCHAFDEHAGPADVVEALHVRAAGPDTIVEKLNIV
jgi:hypothetical protein